MCKVYCHVITTVLASQTVLQLPHSSSINTTSMKKLLKQSGISLPRGVTVRESELLRRVQTLKAFAHIQTHTSNLRFLLKLSTDIYHYCWMRSSSYSRNTQLVSKHKSLCVKELCGQLEGSSFLAMIHRRHLVLFCKYYLHALSFLLLWLLLT